MAGIAGRSGGEKEKVVGTEEFLYFCIRSMRDPDMNCRRYISLWLLAVYLLATGGSAWLSLTCGCLERDHAREHVAAHLCASGHHDAEMLCETCACDRHSTEIRLYTVAADDASPCKCAVLALPHCLAAAQAARLAAPKFRKERTTAPPVPTPQAPCLRVAGLRAPPASV